MSARPNRIPQWATDAAYAAVGKPWDGMAPTLEPPDGLKAEGWEPGVAPNARFINWLFHQIGVTLAYLVDVQIRNWVSRTAAFLSTSSPNISALWHTAYDDGLAGSTPSGHGPTMLVLGAASGANSPPAMMSLSGDEWLDTQAGITGTAYAMRRGIYVDGDGVNLWIIVGDVVGGFASCATHARDLSSGVWVMRSTSVATWYGIAHGPGEANPVVIVGSGGTIDTSTNGTLWINRTSFTVQTLRQVAYGAGQYVAVGDLGVIRTSPTGAAWTARTAPGASDLVGVTYDPRAGCWVIVDDVGQVFTSVDAVTWTLGLTPPAFVMDGAPGGIASDDAGALLIWENTLAGHGGTLAYVSTDGGATWSQGIWIGTRSTDGGSVTNVAWCGEFGWMAVGGSGIGIPVALHQSLRL